MTTTTVQEAEVLARAAGLDKAWAEHRADVLEAIASARRLQVAFQRPGDPAVEPIPPYAVPGARKETKA